MFKPLRFSKTSCILADNLTVGAFFFTTNEEFCSTTSVLDDSTFSGLFGSVQELGRTIFDALFDLLIAESLSKADLL